MKVLESLQITNFTPKPTQGRVIGSDTNYIKSFNRFNETLVIPELYNFQHIYLPGNYYDSAINTASSSTYRFSQDELIINPYYTNQRIRIDQIGIVVTGNTEISDCYIVAYDTNFIGEPTNVLFISDNLNTTSSGYKAVSVDFTFGAFKMYYIGLYCSKRVSFRSLAVGQTIPLGLVTSTSTTYYSSLVRTISNTPDPYNIQAVYYSNKKPISVRFRVAEVLL